jgi:hypothetical protein
VATRNKFMQQPKRLRPWFAGKCLWLLLWPQWHRLSLPLLLSP